MSTKAEPTPGEWEADDISVVTERGNVIGTAITEYLSGSVDCEAVANARLFAASKDLLEAGEDLCSIATTPTDADTWRLGVANMRAAIAKARGES